MLLDYNNKQVVLIEERGESFIDIQDNCHFNLCVRLRGGNYEVPYISLPILIKTLKSIDYTINKTQKLIDYHNNLKAERKLLESLKLGNDVFMENAECKEIITYLKEQENIIKKNCKKFKGFFGNQVDTIIFGIIGKRIVIGNDIGTGKTLTSIMIAKFLMERRGAKKTLILLPASLAKNFYNDYQTYFKDGRMMLISSEAKKKRPDLYKTFKTTPRIKFLITNYEKCLFDYEDLKTLKPDVLIVDEFHKMKNFKDAKRSANFFRMVSKFWRPEYRYPMSGTPIENRMFDLYPVFKLLDDGKILGGEKFFDINFIEYDEITFRVYHSKHNYSVVTKQVPVGFKHHNFVKKLISPFVIRKKLDLPAGIYKKNVMITPSKPLLEAMRRHTLEEGNASAKYYAQRQFLCDTMRGDYADNPKFDELENIITQTRSKIVIFSFFKCSIYAIEKWLTERGYGCVTCQGGDGKDAFDAVRDFVDDDTKKCLVTTDKINFGHNIQEAQIVIEWEKPINPTTTMQRAGRCYRAGQTKDVHVFSFIVKKTVEENIFEAVNRKEDIINKIIEPLSVGDSDTSLDEMCENIEQEMINTFK